MTANGAGPLRVGLVCPYSFDTPGGVQSHVRGLADYLRSQGHQAEILAPGSLANEGAETTGFTSAGAAVAVPYNGSVARVNFGPRSAARVARWLRQGRFDLVHIHEPITPSISVLALWAATVPVVATFHTATPGSRAMRLAGGVMRATVAKIDAGVAVSKVARRVVLDHLGRDAVVIPNGFDYGFFGSAARCAPPARRSPAGLPGWRGGTGPRLTFLGRLDEPRKGLETLLEALPAIRTCYPGLEIAIAGQGSRPLPAGCRRLGVVTDAEKAELLATSDVFVAPHLSRESFGLVLLEAMAAGAPVVASDLPAFLDLLHSDAATPAALGSTFPAGNPSALATAVIGALGDRDTARVRAAQEASRHYDWSVVGAAVTEVYRATRDTERRDPRATADAASELVPMPSAVGASSSHAAKN